MVRMYLRKSSGNEERLAKDLIAYSASKFDRFSESKEVVDLVENFVFSLSFDFIISLKNRMTDHPKSTKLLILKHLRSILAFEINQIIKELM